MFLFNFLDFPTSFLLNLVNISIAGEDKFDGVVYANETGPCAAREIVKHHIRQPLGGSGTLAYANIGDFHDVIQMPPLSNVTVSNLIILNLL